MAEDRAVSEGRVQSLGWGERRQNQNGVVFHRSSRVVVAVRNGDDDNHTDDGSGSEVSIGNGIEYDDHEKIKLPQSTHSLLFTENIFSVPFAFALFVFFVSIACLGLALLDNLNGGSPGNPLNIPANVPPEVRAAQYLSILIALTMEEEIPAGTNLLRMIPKSSVERFGVSYGKFVTSAMCRLAIGYMFLLNVFLVLAQSERVLDMFYDMLALNFVSMIDDIAFQLAKYDILGKHLRLAASAKCFRAEFEKKPYVLRKKMTIFVKLIYLFNLLVFVGGMIYISVLQKKGHFQCSSITVTFGEDIWEHAWVSTPDGQLKSRVLVYSYFNGVYKQNGTHAGRPVYKEMRKSSVSPFETIIGAEIKYCTEESAWVFSHENIKKAKTPEESSCPWLLRSPDTQAYDLMDVSGEWEIWVGVINHGAKMDSTCNECQDNTDCNLNGICTHDKQCYCTDAGYYGMRCELEEPCSRIIGNYNDSWSILYNRQCKHLHEYGRPAYTLQHTGDILNYNIQDEDIVNLVFSGSRWFAIKIVGGRKLDIQASLDAMEVRGVEYHAFWENTNSSYDNDTIAVSDPTSRSYPVGVDFYRVGEKGDQFGPFGVLHPLQEPPGHGYFRCGNNVTDVDAGFSNFFTHCNKNSSNT